MTHENSVNAGGVKAGGVNGDTLRHSFTHEIHPSVWLATLLQVVRLSSTQLRWKAPCTEPSLLKALLLNNAFGGFDLICPRYYLVHFPGLHGSLRKENRDAVG